MNEFFPFENALSEDASSAQLYDILQSYRFQKMTGLVQASFAPEQRLLLCYARGKVNTAYLDQLEVWRRLEPIEWAALLDENSFQVRTLRLPLEGVRIIKLLVERAGLARTVEVRTETLKSQLKEWNLRPDIHLVTLRWPQAEAVLVLAGKADEVDLAAFSRPGEFLTGQPALQAFVAWVEDTCEAGLHQMPVDAPAWQEYLLHRSFIRTMERIFDRYEELAGRNLANLLHRNLSAAALNQGWRIEEGGRELADAEAFKSLSEALQAYRLLASFCLAEIESVVGPRLTGKITRDALAKLDCASREILENYPLLVTKDYKQEICQ